MSGRTVMTIDHPNLQARVTVSQLAIDGESVALRTVRFGGMPAIHGGKVRAAVGLDGDGAPPPVLVDVEPVADRDGLIVWYGWVVQRPAAGTAAQQ